jgi:hypothetical protein
MSDGPVTHNRNMQPLADLAGTDTAYDARWIQKIVSEVLRRLREPLSSKDLSEHKINQRVVTAETIESLGPAAVKWMLRSDAVVTPAAKDLARQKGIELSRCPGPIDQTSCIPQHRDNSHLNNARLESDQLIDTDDAARGRSIMEQLRKRNVTNWNTRILLSNSPAATVVREVNRGEIAVMISSLDQIDRFAAECAPTTWVLDMKQLNLAAATNVAAQIAKRERRIR